MGLEVGVELVGRGLHLVHRLFDRVVDVGVRFGRRVGGTAVTPVTGRPPGPRGKGGMVRMSKHVFSYQHYPQLSLYLLALPVIVIQFVSSI